MRTYTAAATVKLRMIALSRSAAFPRGQEKQQGTHPDRQPRDGRGDGRDGSDAIDSTTWAVASSWSSAKRRPELLDVARDPRGRDSGREGGAGAAAMRIGELRPELVVVSTRTSHAHGTSSISVRTLVVHCRRKGPAPQSAPWYERWPHLTSDASAARSTCSSRPLKRGTGGRHARHMKSCSSGP